jgi:hypothetical protein
VRSLYRFPSHHGHVLVPLDLVRKEAELAWCLDWKHTLTTRMTNGQLISVVQVPMAEWEEHWLDPDPSS